jgi:hypothetical protein
MTYSLRHIAQMPLMLCLSVMFLVGCSTVGVRFEDRTEAIRLEAPLIDRLQISMDAPADSFMPGPFYIWYDHLKYGQGLETTLSETLITSNVARMVGGKKGTANDGSELRVVASFDGTVPAYKWVGRIAYGVFSTFLLFIPYAFYSETNEARLAADIVIVAPSGKMNVPVRVHTELEFELGASKVGADTWPSMMALGMEDLSRKIVLEIKRHPHWFNAAR